MMKQHIAAAMIILCAATVLAGGMKVRVNKDVIAVSPTGMPGQITLSAPPGSVAGMHPIRFTAQNKKNGFAAAGNVMPDGSFLVHLAANPKDTLKIEFVGADGEKKELKVKIPKTLPMAAVPPMQQELRTETVTVPVGEPAPGAPAKEDSPQSPDGITRSEKELNASGVIE
ncbi:MAG: hypothetical protein NT045_09160 [Candidatus Aureabacteria bacterium]|nr:hypothetical protein [Candidatus Auribacterota bacterium]